MNTPRRWQIIWPEFKLLLAEEIRTIYADAVANELYGVEIGLSDPHEMALNLDSVGLFTLGKN